MRHLLFCHVTRHMFFTHVLRQSIGRIFKCQGRGLPYSWRWDRYAVTDYEHTRRNVTKDRRPKLVSAYPKIIFSPTLRVVGRDSSVGIATRYGLEGPGIESRWGRDFPHPSRSFLGAHPASYTMGTGSFPGVKRPGRSVDHPLHLAPRLKKEYSYTYSSPGPSCPVLGWTSRFAWLVETTNILGHKIHFPDQEWNWGPPI